MGFESAMTAHLKSSVSLTSIVGDAIYYEDAPQGQKSPYVVWFEVSEIPYQHLGGESNLTERSVQVNCFSVNPVEANAMVEAVRMSMSGVYHVLGNGQHTVPILNCMSRGKTPSGKIPFEDGSGRSMRVRGIEFSIGLPQTVPLLV